MKTITGEYVNAESATTVVRAIWESDPYGTNEPMDIETAREDVLNFELSGIITPEEYMNAWNEMIEEFENEKD